jgi:glyoxylase-like metal-dependent hydrolase (beta-lactamase superfamily II)
MQGTALFKPDHEFEQSYSIQSIGRSIQVLYFGHSSGPGDVAVLDQQSGVLFAGGLLDNLRIPDVQDSDLKGWSQALHALGELPIKLIVPGHGPLGSTAVIGSVGRYLVQLNTSVLGLLQSGTSLLDVPDAAQLPEFALWDQYEVIHRRNASVLFVRLEREQLMKQAAAPD